eukprot:scaffold20882_cov139-Skeletonema_marinoi.AAC.13
MPARESSLSVNPTEAGLGLSQIAKQFQISQTKSWTFHQTQEEKSSAMQAQHSVYSTPLPLTLNHFRHGGCNQPRAKQKERENPFLGLAAASPFTLQSRRSPSPV